MESFKKPVSSYVRKFRWLPLIVIIILSAITIWILYKFKEEKRFAVVKLYGNGTAINFSKTYNFVFFSSGNKNKGALLAEKGDLMGFNNNFFLFSKPKNDSMEVNDTGDSLVYVNGKINSIRINKDADLLPWFRSMKGSDLTDFETIVLSSNIPENYTPFLKEIARKNPYISLVFEENDSVNIVDSYIKKADFFKPRFVSITVTQDQLSLLSHWTTAEFIYIKLLDSVITTALPAMPSVKQCIIYNDNPVAITSSFFSNNMQLRQLTLLGGMPDYSLLSPLENLQELIINNADKSADMATIKNKMNKLSVLIVSGIATNIDVLLSAQKLRWLGLPENTSQLQFNSINTKLQGLQVMQITGNDSIIDYKPLQQLPNLKGLVITDTVTDKESLYALKKLRYLSLPQNNKADSAYLLAMEKALPGCIVVPNSGACLGSGWLLLLVPLVFIFSLVFIKIQTHIKPL